MDKLEQITERLRRQKPMVDDEEAFVDGIMAQLMDEPLSHTPLWLKVVRATSSLAATFLVMLYVWQLMDVVDESATSQPRHIEQGTSGLMAQEPEPMASKIDKYLAEREKRHEMRKHSISHNYARL